MKLTKVLRQAFVNAAIADVPQVDHGELIRELAMKYAIDVAMPQDVKAMYKKHPEYFALNQLKVGDTSNYHTYEYVYVPMPDDRPFSAEVNAAVVELTRASRDQAQAISRLQTKLQAVADSMTTRKALADALPEFAKYLPEEATKSSMLPAITNTVAEFIKAGWPKGQVTA